MTAHYDLEEVRFFALVPGPQSGALETEADIAKHFGGKIGEASSRLQLSLETIKQVVEESQVLIQEIQESVDEYRTNVEKRRQSRKESAPGRDITAQTRTIDRRVSHLVSLLNAYKSYVRLKLEDCITRMITTNILPAYSVSPNLVTVDVWERTADADAKCQAESEGDVAN